MEHKHFGSKYAVHGDKGTKNTSVSGLQKHGYFQVNTVPEYNICRVCGKRHTDIQNCKYKNYRCNLCGPVGHLAKMCNKSKSTNFLNVESVDDGTHESLICNIETNDLNPIILDVKIINVKLKAQLDSGSGLTIISEKTFYELFNKNTILKKVFKNVCGYTGEKINILGFFLTGVSFKDRVCELFKIFVVEKGGLNLLDRDFMEKFSIKLTNINMLEYTELNFEQLKNKYSKLFNNDLGEYVHEKFKIRLKDNANLTPIFYKPRQIPFAFKEQVEEQLCRLEKLGVISQVESNDRLG